MHRTTRQFRTALAIAALVALVALSASGGLLLADPPENNPATGAPRIEGAVQLNEELYACALACIRDADGMTKAVISYQWIRRDGADETDIPNATGALYTIVEADVGKTLRVRASFTDDAGNPEKLTSAATPTVSGTPNSATTGVPAITGTAKVGQTLSVDTSGIADADGLTKASFSGLWRAGNRIVHEVRPGDDFSYQVSRGDLGDSFKATVDFKDDAGKSITLESDSTAAVAPATPAAPELFVVSKDSSGDPELDWEDPIWDYGGELRGQPTWGDGGSPITGYVVQWKEKDDSWSTAADVSEASVTVRRHTIRNLNGGTEYAIRVLAVNAVGRGAPTADAFVTTEGTSNLSTDATLSALSLSSVDFGAFDPATLSYTAQVANSVSRTLVAPTPGHPRASYVIELGGVADADGLIDLSEGSNVITIEVTAEDGQTTRTYTVTVTRSTSSEGGTPTPPPDTDTCTEDLGTLSDTVSRTGTWAADCQSQVPDRGYARYYTFILDQDGEATINLTSTVDTYLYLREGSATSGTSLHHNDDIESGNANSRIVADLDAGTYTVEATTYAEAATGSFTLSIGSTGTQTPVTTACTPATLTLPVSGQAGSWSDDCDSEAPGRGHARYYSFTLTDAGEVTIDLASDTVDTYLYLRSGSATSGDALHSNDDIESGNTDSRVAETLAAGTYTIEATTYNEAVTGSFTLSVTSSETQTPVTTGCTATSLTLPATGTTGSWGDDCESSAPGRGYARYYSFTLADEVEVTIDLTSTVDTYLYLRSGDATSGDTLHSNDDVESGNTNSRIAETLAAGAYTIEATTYAEDTRGGFTLSVTQEGSETPAATGCDPAALTLPATGVTGNWANDCESQVPGRGYARYYSFTLERDGQVIIDLASDEVDAYLYLRAGGATSGDYLRSNDDIVSGNTDSQIAADLDTGSYTIEATTYAEFAVGGFTLGVGGRATRAPVVTACSSTALTLPAADVAGAWVEDCQSSVSGRGHARYYSFTIEEHSDVTISLSSTVDTHLYLREGNASDGEFLHENDNIAEDDNNSRISEMLLAGSYTVEATTNGEADTYPEDFDGGFAISVSAQATQTPVAVGCDPATLTLPADSIPGSWAFDCHSDVPGRGYARYYSFTLAERSDVTIDLASDVDTYLYLREDDGATGDYLHQNDDVESGNTDSQIAENLAAGTYTVEATTYAEDITGSVHPQRQRRGGGGPRLHTHVPDPARHRRRGHVGQRL